MHALTLFKLMIMPFIVKWTNALNVVRRTKKKDAFFFVQVNGGHFACVSIQCFIHDLNVFELSPQEGWQNEKNAVHAIQLCRMEVISSTIFPPFKVMWLGQCKYSQCKVSVYQMWTIFKWFTKKVMLRTNQSSTAPVTSSILVNTQQSILFR